jgi:hypothetical protein
MSQPIPIGNGDPTIMKLLYYFSYLCATCTLPLEEKNIEGQKVNLKDAPKTVSRAPRINPRATLNPRQSRAESTGEYTRENPRRSPRSQPPRKQPVNQPSLSLQISSRTKGSYLGCKGRRGMLGTGEVVFVKLWDGWKMSSEGCEQEAAVYLHLKELWGKGIPKFLGYGTWSFYHVLLLQFVEV